MRTKDKTIMIEYQKFHGVGELPPVSKGVAYYRKGNYGSLGIWSDTMHRSFRNKNEYETWIGLYGNYYAINWIEEVENLKRRR